ncbi:MAG TPA: trehalase family glycosidase [Candidatus Limnocylindria bacterium]|nr:trehalase family glycosidase [Candidatus Limnocylindria bacterium]
MSGPLRWAVVAATLILAVLIVVAAVTAVRPQSSVALAPWEELDTRWGTYLSEREWGTPREAIGGDPWGMDYLEAVRIPYSHGEDGIAGLVDRHGIFHLGWAVWDTEQVRVAERLFGWGNHSGSNGEEIVDRRTFGPNTPTSSYAETTLLYPNTDARFRIVFTTARADSVSGVMTATVDRTVESDGDEPSTLSEAPLHVILKGWFADPGLRVEPIPDGLLLRGRQTTVAVVGDGVDGQQVSGEKRAIDERLREDGVLAGTDPGHIGALGHRLSLGVSEAGSVTFGWAEDADPAAAEERARATLRDAEAVVQARRDEAEDLFSGQVTDHEAVYRQALMGVLWNQRLYRWDGGSSWIPEWEGRVDADDVLILPDPWEFPWLATWDSAFHAVTAGLIDPQLGADQLRFILSPDWQQPDGHIPCAEFVMDDECPPVFSWAAWRLHEAGAGTDFLAEVFPGLAANHAYWQETLQVSPGLYTGGFLGMDNLPRAPGQPQADASAWMAFSARHLADIADAIGETEAAARYRAEVDQIAAAVNATLWDAERGFYFDRDTDGVKPILTKSYSGLIPLVAGIVPDDRVPAVLDALRDERQFLTPYGIRSTTRDSVLYRSGYTGKRGVNSSWLGPVWMPINYLLVGALEEHDPDFAADLRERLVELVERDWERTGRFHEYFDADDGTGLGADHQAGWTALVANLVAEGWPAD